MISPFPQDTHVDLIRVDINTFFSEHITCCSSFFMQDTASNSGPVIKLGATPMYLRVGTFM